MKQASQDENRNSEGNVGTLLPARVGTLLETIIVTVVAVISSSLTLWLLEHPIKYWFFLLQVELMLFLYCALLKKTTEIAIPRLLPVSSGYISDLMCIMLSAILLFSAIGLIDPPPLFRLISAILLTTLLSGLAIMNVTGLSRHFSKLEQLIFSYTLGFALTAFLVFLLHFILRFAHWHLLAPMVYLSLGLISLVKRFIVQTRNTSSMRRPSVSRSIDLSILLLILVFFLSTIGILFPEFARMPDVDISYHYGHARVLLRYPEYGYRDFTYFWFHLFLGGVYKLSQPSVEMMQTFLMPFNFLMPLSFYVMAKEYVERIDKRLPILATVLFSVFSCFAWIYFAQLKLESILTYYGTFSQTDLLQAAGQSTYLGTSYSRGSGFAVLGHSPFTVSWVITFSLLYLLKRLDLKKSQFLPLFSVLLFSSFLTHVAEAVMLVIFIGFYSLLESENLRLRDSLGSALIAFVGGGLIYIGVFSNPRVYYHYSNVLSVLVPILITTGSLVLSRMSTHKVQAKRKQRARIIPRAQAKIVSEAQARKRLKVKVIFRAQAKKKPRMRVISKVQTRRFAFPLFLMLIFAFCLSSLVFASFAGDFTMSLVSGIWDVPWFFYAELNGVGGLLAIIGFYFYLREVEKYEALKLFIAFALFIILAGRFISYLNSSFLKTGYREATLAYFYLAVPLSVVGSLGLVNLFKARVNVKRSTKRIISSALIIGLVTTLGLSSTLLVVEHWAFNVENLKISESEKEALNFLDAEFDKHPDSRVFAPTSKSRDNLVFAAPSENIIMREIRNTAVNPDIIYGVLLTANPFIMNNYIYLHSRDLSHLQKSFSGSYLMRYLLPNLQPLFRNHEAAIYRLPSNINRTLNLDDEAALIVPFDRDTISSGYLYSYDILAKSGLNYTVMYDLDQNIINKNLLILSFDPPEGNITNLQITEHFSDPWSLNSWSPTTIKHLAPARASSWRVENHTLSGGPGEGALSRISGTNFTAEFTVRPIDVAEYGYFGLVYGWRDSGNYLTATLGWVNNKGLHLKFSEVVDGEVSHYPASPPWHLVTEINCTLGEDYTIKVEVSNLKHEISVNGKIYLKWKKEAQAGKVGLFYRIFDKIAFDNFQFSGTMTANLRTGKDYLDYVESGSKLVVLNANGYGFFGNQMLNSSTDSVAATRIEGNGNVTIPSVTVRAFSTNLEVLSRYIGSNGREVPFAIRSVYGAGEIWYVNVCPLIESLSEDEGKTLYQSFGDTLWVTGIRCRTGRGESSQATKTDVIFKSVNLNGETFLSTNSVIVAPFSTKHQVRISAQEHVTTFSDVSHIETRNYTKAEIHTSNVTLEEGSGLYTRLITSSNLTMKLKGQAVLTVRRSNNLVNTLVLEDPRLEIFRAHTDFRPATLYLRTPLVNVSGRCTFEELFVADRLLDWHLETQGQDLLVDGFTRFRMTYSDIYSMAEDFSLDGDFLRDPPITSWDEGKALPSTIIYSLSLIPFFLGVILIYRLRSNVMRRLNVDS